MAHTNRVLPKNDAENGAGNDSRLFKIRSDAVTRAFERARRGYEDECEKARARPDSKCLTDLRFQDPRHEATSRLAGIFSMHELTKITGHKDPRMLMRNYHSRAKIWRSTSADFTGEA